MILKCKIATESISKNSFEKEDIETESTVLLQARQLTRILFPFTKPLSLRNVALMKHRKACERCSKTEGWKIPFFNFSLLSA